MNATAGPAHSAGYTLVEILAVIAVLGMVAGLGLGGLLRSVRSDPISAAVAALRERGQLARSAARDTSGLTLTLVDHGFTVLPTGTVGDLALPEPLHLAWTFTTSTNSVDSGSHPVLAIDQHGRSRDATVLISAGDRSERWRWLGLTGEWVRTEIDQDQRR